MKPGIRSISVMVVDRDSMPRGLDPAAARRATTSRRYRVSSFGRDGSRESHARWRGRHLVKSVPRSISVIVVDRDNMSRGLDLTAARRATTPGRYRVSSFD